ncbi:phosphoacceptor receiver (REC) domain-containing protein [Haloferula helveola]|uniref:Phosphoacceptor receiver (REC) domain-containing protein n=1 Tax=Haloferula helveola TaxID=490095 RepID=A0ABN6H396_9BACT|nr:phosphoacceptor receiver (REC) domain-containing protein [Haloferula helveola]
MKASRNILLIEDDEDHAELLTRNANPSDKISRIGDGGEALDFLFGLEQSPTADRPDLIILDLKLPTADGTMILAKIKTDEKAKILGLHRIPVVIVTSSINPRDISNAYDNYTNSYLEKPRSPEGWAHLMRQIDEYWLTCNKSSLGLPS